MRDYVTKEESKRKRLAIEHNPDVKQRIQHVHNECKRKFTYLVKLERDAARDAKCDDKNSKWQRMLSEAAEAYVLSCSN